MNSYYKTNRNLREEYENLKMAAKYEENNMKFPNSLTFKNFFKFLIYLTFVYEETYPL